MRASLRALPLLATIVSCVACAQSSPYERFILGATFVGTAESIRLDIDSVGQMDQMSFNYWFNTVDDVDPGAVRDWVAAAAARGAYLLPPLWDPVNPADAGSGLIRLGYGWDYRIEAENALTSNRGAYALTADAAASSNGTQNAVVARESDGAGILLAGTESDLLWSRYGDPRRPRQVIARFRLRWDGDDDSGAVVAALRVRHGGAWVTRSVAAGDFDACSSPCYVDIEVEPVITLNARFEYDIEYMGRGTLYADYIHVTSPIARELIAGEFDSHIVNFLAAYNTPVNTGVFAEVLVTDEPPAFEARAIAHIDSVVFAAYGKRATANLYPHEHAVPYFLDVLDPPALMTDPYVLGSLFIPDRCHVADPVGYTTLLANPDFPAGQLWGVNAYVEPGTEYHAELQRHLDCLAEILDRSIRLATAAGIPLWYVPQSHGIFGKSNVARWYALRPPSEAETRLLIYLGVAYGAKGIIYHLYKTITPGTEEVNVGLVTNGFRGHPPVRGVEPTNRHDSDYDHDLVPGDSVYTGYSRRWEAVRRANAELAAAGPTLMQLTHVVTYNSTDGHHTSSPVVSIRDAASQGADHVQVGVLDHPGDAADYVVLVNRMARPQDTRSLSITLGPRNAPRVVTDVTNGEVVAQLAAGQRTFSLTMPPGDGRILRIGP